MPRLLALVVFVASVSAAGVAAADSGQWAGPGSEHDYCAGLLEWGREHPEVREFDGWPAYCRATYPDLTTTSTTTTPTTTEAPPAPAAATTPRFTG